MSEEANSLSLNRTLGAQIPRTIKMECKKCGSSSIIFISKESAPRVSFSAPYRELPEQFSIRTYKCMKCDAVFSD